MYVKILGNFDRKFSQLNHFRGTIFAEIHHSCNHYVTIEIFANVFFGNKSFTSKFQFTVGMNK